MNKKKFLKCLLLIIIFVLVISATIIFLIYKNNLKWHTNNPLIAHALYGIDGISYTNSYEALKQGYSNGLRVFEADFLLTSDDYLVLNHNWNVNEILSYEEFMSKKIYDKYTPIDINTLLLYMKTHKDIYVIVDTKQDMFDPTKVLDVYNKIVEEAIKVDSKLLNRFIIQLYDYEDFENIGKIYNFKNYIFTIYKLEDFVLSELTAFCTNNNIDTIVFPYKHIYNRKINRHDLKTMKDNDLKIYAHTVNNKDLYNTLILNGVDGVFTDFLY